MITFTEISPIVQLIGAIVTAVWAVFQIKATTNTLSQDIKHLSEAVVDLKNTQHEMAKDFLASKDRSNLEMGLIRERLINIESKCKMYHRAMETDDN